MNRYFTLGLLFCALFFTSCDSARIFEQNQEIPETGWAQTNVVKFDVDIKDPSTPAHFYVNVRNADGYPYGNIFLFIKTTFPNGKFSLQNLWFRDQHSQAVPNPQAVPQ